MKPYRICFNLNLQTRGIAGRTIAAGYVELYANDREDAKLSAMARGFIPEAIPEDSITIWEGE